MQSNPAGQLSLFQGLCMSPLWSRSHSSTSGAIFVSSFPNSEVVFSVTLNQGQSPDTEWGPIELLGTNAFCVPHFFDSLKQPSFSLHDFTWVTTSRFKQLIIRERRSCETQGSLGHDLMTEQQQQWDQEATKNQEQPWGKDLFPQQWIRIIFFSYFANTKTPSRWEKLTLMMIYCLQACRSQTSWTGKLMMLTPTHLTSNPSEECP